MNVVEWDRVAKNLSYSQKNRYLAAYLKTNYGAGQRLTNLLML